LSLWERVRVRGNFPFTLRLAEKGSPSLVNG
ncbi:hypothetical protein AZZ62_004339, partial [Klebsiella variicola]